MDMMPIYMQKIRDFLEMSSLNEELNLLNI